MKIKTIIIEDELRAQELLEEMIKLYCPDLEIVSICSDLPSGVLAIRKYNPELVLLDIEMPGHSGLEILDFFAEKEVHFSIIFTTAYNNYAISAFKLSAIDYLTKPIEPTELIDSIERFKKKNKPNFESYSGLNELLKNKDQFKLAVPIGNMIKLIDINKILFLKADSSYTEIHLTDQNKLIASRTLKNFTEALNDEQVLFRCHKSYIVNLNHLTGYSKADGGSVILNENITIPISSEKMEELKGRINLVKR